MQKEPRRGEGAREEMRRGLGEASPTQAEEGGNGEVEGEGVGSGGGGVGDGGVDGTGDVEEVGTADGGSAKASGEA